MKRRRFLIIAAALLAFAAGATEADFVWTGTGFGGALSLRLSGLAPAQAPRLTLRVPVAARAAFSARDYGDVAADPGRVQAIIRRLSPLHPAERIAGGLRLADLGDWRALAEGLMRDHYDPRYAKHRARYGDQERAVVDLADLTDLDLAASRVEAALRDFPRA